MIQSPERAAHFEATMARIQAELAKRQEREAEPHPCHCLRCGHDWEAIVASPKKCRRCRRTNWNQNP